MLSRAVSAPANHAYARGILRYDEEPMPALSGVKFAPLPETEMWAKREKFHNRLGVAARQNIINRQRQRPGGTNYTLSSARILEERLAAKSADNKSEAPLGSNTATSSSPSDSLTVPKEDLELRRSASEDGTVNTQAAHKRARVGSLKFWKKPSKRPVLSTVPSQAEIYRTESRMETEESSPNVTRPEMSNTDAVTATEARQPPATPGAASETPVDLKYSEEGTEPSVAAPPTPSEEQENTPSIVVVPASIPSTPRIHPQFIESGAEEENEVAKNKSTASLVQNTTPIDSVSLCQNQPSTERMPES